MNLISIAKTLVPVSILMTGCASQMQPETDVQNRAGADLDYYDTDGNHPVVARDTTAIPSEETYCDTEYLRNNPNADCDDYGIDRDQMTGGR